MIGLAIAGYHLLSHWSWVKAVTLRLWGSGAPVRQPKQRSSTPNRSRIYYLIDAALILGFFSMASTGLVISTWLDLALANYATWRAIHIAASIGTLLVAMVKIGLHWRWIATVARDIFAIPAAPQADGLSLRRPALVQLTPGIKRMSRREFLEVMGVAGVAAVFASSSAVKSLQAGTDTTTTSNLPNTAQSSAAGQQTSSAEQSAATGACSVRCRRGCSFPGRCRKYVDANRNNLCDLGECI